MAAAMTKPAWRLRTQQNSVAAADNTTYAYKSYIRPYSGTQRSYSWQPPQ
jgi:hypothetical protein